jgi:hypothetical protein
MPVPNLPNFSLQTVINEIAGTQTSLAGCFVDADPGGFDPAYSGAKDRLSNFRNYNDNSATLTISPTTRTSTSLGETFVITVTTTGSPAWTVTDNQLWISTSPSSGTGNGSFNVTVQSNSSGFTRFGSVSVFWSGATRSCSITQTA